MSIIIKALNEERRIAACIESALRACEGLQAEVILVDSLSDDRTVSIASAYPIRILQFAHREDRCCGAAVELGWRHSVGDYVYLLDADMRLEPGFLEHAISFLVQHPDVAGVAGKLMDTRALNATDIQRLQNAKGQTKQTVETELGGGGLYKRSAIKRVGYLAHQSLRAYEEAELGFRLRTSGFRLVRLADISVYHEGHDESNFHLMRRVWRNGRLMAATVMLKTAVGRPWFKLVLQKLKHLLSTLGLQILSLAVVAYFVATHSYIRAFVAFGGIWSAVFALLVLKHKSVALAAWRIIFWNFSVLALIMGLRVAVRDPLAPIESKILSDF